MREPDWLIQHREDRPYVPHYGMQQPFYSRSIISAHPDQPAFMKDNSFNRHSLNDGQHVSPYDDGAVLAGLDGLVVRLHQGVDEEQFKRTLARTLRATTGISPYVDPEQDDWEEMMKGGLQSALETQTIIFEVIGASRALTHQLVRTRKAAFHQQSQRATWYGDRPNARWPDSIVNPSEGRTEKSLRVFDLWEKAQQACWEAYKAACDLDVSYQDARYILPEGTMNYILCSYTVSEFINVFAYRGCSMFLWEMVGVMREMRQVLLEAHPFLEPYVKISCEKGPLCNLCKGSGFVWEDGIAVDQTEVKRYYAEPEQNRTQMMQQCPGCHGIGGSRRCTFQGWENVEQQCDFPWAKQDNRVFLPNPKFRIGG